MIRKAVGTVISRITVTATTNRTIGRLAARMSTTVGPRMAIAMTATTVITISNGTTVKMTLPGKVNRFQLLPTTVIWSCLAGGRTHRGEGAGEQGSERSPSYESEPADPATRASVVPPPAEAAARSFVHS